MKKLFLMLLVFAAGIIFNGTSSTQVEAQTGEYKNIHPNINLKVLSNQYNIQYQWEIKPGVRVDERGGNIEEIRFENKYTRPGEPGHWRFQKPLAFQVVKGKQVYVDVDIIDKKENKLGFRVGNYNHNAELSIRRHRGFGFIQCNAEKPGHPRTGIHWDPGGPDFKLDGGKRHCGG